jgi:hypothetical protein
MQSKIYVLVMLFVMHKIYVTVFESALQYY